MKKLFIFLIMLLGTMGVAFAGNLPEPVAGDKAMLVLQSLFGSLFGGNSSDAFGTINKTYLGYVLLMGGVMGAYTMLASTLTTAHDGEMLGKQFSSIWVPIKYAFGVALIIPASTYCAAQMIVASLITTGIGAADETWSAYMSSGNMKNIAQVNIDTPNVRDTAYKIFASQLCLSGFKSAYASGDDVLKSKDEKYAITVEDGVVNKIIKFGDTSESSITKDACGRVEVRKVQFPNVPTIANVANPINYGFEVAKSIDQMKTISDAHWTQTMTLISSLGTVADDVANTIKASGSKSVNIASTNEKIEKAVKVYQDQVYQLGTQIVASEDAFKTLSESASKDGFMLAGAWNMKIYMFIEQVQKTIANVPVATGPTGITEGKYSGDVAVYKEALTRIMADSASAQLSWGVAETQGGSQTGWWDTLVGTVKNGMDIRILAKKIFSSVADFVIQGDQNIVLQLTRMGNWVLAIATDAYFGGAALSMIPGIGSYITMTIQMLLPMAILSGFILSYVLPMVPFLLWIGSVFAWLVSCVEAIIVVPLWVMISFLNPHGSDFVGSAGQGYRLLLQLLFKPVLMIFGLVAAISLIDVLGKVLNIIYSQVFLIAQSDSSIIFFFVGAVFAFPIMYGATAFVLIMKCTGLVHTLPDQIIQWIGGGHAGLGQHAESMGSSGVASAGAGGAMGAATGSLGNAMNSTAGNLVKNSPKGDLPGSLNKPSFSKEQIKSSPLASVLSGKTPKTMDESIMSTNLAAMNKTLGDSQDMFKEKLEDSFIQNPEFSDEQHLDNAYKQALNNEYGAGAGAMVKSAGGGSFDSAGAMQMAKSYSDAKAQYKTVNPSASNSDVVKAFSSATAEAKDNFLNDKSSIKHKEDGKGLSEFMSESLNRNLNMSVNEEIDTTPMKKDEPKEPEIKDDENKE